MAVPSTKHELVVDMFEHRPALAAELLRDCFGVPIDSDAVATARVAGATLGMSPQVSAVRHQLHA